MTMVLLKKSTRRGIRWIIGILLLLEGIGGFQSPVVSAPSSAVELQLHLRQQAFLLGEPVLVECTLVNQGKGAVQVREPQLSTQMVRYWIRSEKGGEKKYELSFVIEPSSLPVELAPGEKISQQEFIFYNYPAKDLAFPQEGKYVLKAEYVGYVSTRDTPAPAEIAITLKKNPSVEKELEKLFREKATADFFNNVSRHQDIIIHLEKAAAKNPKSQLGHYAKYFLALHYAQTYSDKPKDLEKALEWMKGADTKGFQLQPEGLYFLAQWNWQLGKSAEAFGYLDRLIQEFSDTPISQTASALKKNWSTQKPPEPPKKIVPMEGKVKKEIEKILKEYFDAFAKTDLRGCLTQLDENFLYNGVLNKEAMAEELKEDFEKFKRGGLKIDWKLEKIEKIDEVVTALATVTYSLNGQPLNSPSSQSIEFIQKNKSWFLKNLNSQ